MSFVCREELAIKGVKPNTDIPFQYTYLYHKSFCIGNGMTAASTHPGSWIPTRPLTGESEPFGARSLEAMGLNLSHCP
jgi:hypothetical protein